jgi:hypothetical protein
VCNKQQHTQHVRSSQSKLSATRTRRSDSHFTGIASSVVPDCIRELVTSRGMDEQRALLDQLMGTTRDLSETQKGRVHKIRFSDHEVCKNYLCGLCPFVAFAATKSDMVGDCNSFFRLLSFCVCIRNS